MRKRSALAALQQLQKTLQRKRKTFNLDNATSIALLFDATTEKTRREALEWAKVLGKGNREVRILGFFNDKKPPMPTPEFDYFFLKETEWNFAPKSEKAFAFEKAKTDLLLVVNPDQLIPLEWIALRHNASMKIGMPTEHPNDFDLQVETPLDKGIPYFAEQLRVFLAKIG